MRFDTARFEACMSRSRGSLGSPRRREGLFPCPGARPHSTVRQAFDRLASFFSYVPPLQSSYALRSAQAFRHGHTCHRISVLLATSPGRVHSRGASQGTADVPSTGVHSLSTVYSSLRLRGLFHPRATYRTLVRSGASSSASGAIPRRATLPPCRCSPGRSSGSRDPPSTPEEPRLRGLTPRGDAFAPARC